MRALSCEEPGRLALVERPEALPQADEVVVDIRRIGLCGTDYHTFHGRQPFLSYPRVMGHELSGTVRSAPDDSALQPGQIVCIEPYLACGSCAACRRGRTNCCARLSVLGVHQDGGMTERLAVPEKNVVDAAGLSLDQAAMVEFLAIGAHAIRRGQVAAGQRVLVTGAGPIGIAAACFAMARGAAVTVLEREPVRLEFCRRHLTLEQALPADNDAAARLAVATRGEFFDVVIDATGSTAAIEAGFRYVGHGGAYVLLSIVRGDIVFDDPEFHKREATLYASRNATREDFATVIDAIRAGTMPTEALATHRTSLDEAAALIPVWSDPAAGVIKGLIEL